MTIPADSIVAHTLSRMQRNLERRADIGDVTLERSGLLFMGNVHDAFPRQLFLDPRLSPLDKTAWVMIRLYAQQNEGAVFPTYDELQVQLASAHWSILKASCVPANGPTMAGLNAGQQRLWLV